MFKVTNEQLIQIAAVDAGLDPYAEYCTKGVYKAAGYSIRKGEQPVLTLELWCPRISKSQEGELLSDSDSQEAAKSAGTFFMFKTCHLYTRSQVQDAEEIRLEKEAKRFTQQHRKNFRQLVKSMGGIAPDQDYAIPQWCRKSQGLPLDVAVAEVSAAGYMVDDANGLFDLLAAM